MNRSFRLTSPADRHYGPALWAGFWGGNVASFVKWGTENPFPPRTPDRAIPPAEMLQDMGINVSNLVYHYSGHVVNWGVAGVHHLFSIVFALLYCALAEILPVVTLGQGVAFALLITLGFHLSLIHIQMCIRDRYAIALWHSGGRQIVGDLPDAFSALHSTEILGIPIGAFYVLGLALALWLVTEHTPLGRCMYAVGGNPVAARLNGIAVNKYVIGSFIASSVITGFSGVLIAAEQGVGQASVGMDYLLPALVGAFLGSTTIRPGRVNVWGTVVGIAILAIGIAGIQPVSYTHLDVYKRQLLG